MKALNSSPFTLGEIKQSLVCDSNRTTINNQHTEDSNKDFVSRKIEVQLPTVIYLSQVITVEHFRMTEGERCNYS